MPKTITLPKEGELDLIVEKELYKLPTEAAHNHLHQIGEKAGDVAEKMRSMSLVSLILCGLELMHIQAENKKVNHGLPWKKWVKENCEFSHMTASKYIKSVKCARQGMLEDVDPALIPTIAPSLMSAEELKENCIQLANALQGYGSRRQLYLDLDIISTPTKPTIDDNRNTKGGPKKGDGEAPDMDLERKDAIAAIPLMLKPMDEYFEMGRHQLLDEATLKELDAALQSGRDLLKPLLKPLTK